MPDGGTSPTHSHDGCGEQASHIQSCKVEQLMTSKKKCSDATGEKKQMREFI